MCQKTSRSQILFDSLVVSLFAIFVSGQPALAYVDPSTGSYMIQLMMGSLFGATFWIRTFIRRFNWRKRGRNDEIC